MNNNNQERPMIYSNLNDLREYADPDCSGTMRIHWDVYLPDGEKLLGPDGEDRLKEVIAEAVSDWITVRFKQNDPGIHVYSQLLHEDDIEVDDDNRDTGAE
jgi:hypothetical protein